MNTISKYCKLSFIFGLLLFFNSCEQEDNLKFTEPDAAFRLETPSVSNIFLNFNLPDNPAFTLNWKDNLTGSSSYTIQMSPEIEFENPINLGTSDSNTFSMTVSNFNELLSNAGIESFKSTPIFMRVLADSTESNVVNFEVNSFPENNPVIESPDSTFSIVLSDDMADSNAVTVSWNDPDFSSENSTVVNYILEGALTGTDFENISTVGETEERSLELTHSMLNDLALSAGIEPEEQGSVDMRVKSVIETINGDIVRTSESISITVTTYDTATQPSVWGIVGSGYNDWGSAGPDGQFYTTDQPNVFVAYETLIDGEIKFRTNNDWSSGDDLGDGDNDGFLDQLGGNNIPVTAGNYKITINLNDSSYSIEEWSWGIVGSGYNDWGNDGPDAKMYYDYTTDTFKVSVKLVDGEIKFRSNNDWSSGDDLGDGNNDGVLDQLGGNNIAVTAGHYNVTVNFNNNNYSIEPADVWGIVGSGFNDWGNAGDDFALTEVQPGILYGDIATLQDGEIKFRTNNEWSSGDDLGDANDDGILDQDANNNIPVTAGLYRVRVNLMDNSYSLNKIQ